MSEERSFFAEPKRPNTHWAGLASTQPVNQESKARILAHFGEKAGALGILSHLLEIPYEGGLFGPPLTPALLRLDPDWDNLRVDPRFEKLSEEPKK